MIEEEKKRKQQTKATKTWYILNEQQQATTRREKKIIKTSPKQTLVAWQQVTAEGKQQVLLRPLLIEGQKELCVEAARDRNCGVRFQNSQEKVSYTFLFFPSTQ